MWYLFPPKNVIILLKSCFCSLIYFTAWKFLYALLSLLRCFLPILIIGRKNGNYWLEAPPLPQIPVWLYTLQQNGVWDNVMVYIIILSVTVGRGIHSEVGCFGSSSSTIRCSLFFLYVTSTKNMVLFLHLMIFYPLLPPEGIYSCWNFVAPGDKKGEPVWSGWHAAACWIISALLMTSEAGSSQDPPSLGRHALAAVFNSCGSLLLCTFGAVILSVHFPFAILLSGTPHGFWPTKGPPCYPGWLKIYLPIFICFLLFLTIWDERERLQQEFSFQSGMRPISYITISTITCIVLVIGSIMAPPPKEVYVLIPRIWANVTCTL